MKLSHALLIWGAVALVFVSLPLFAETYPTPKPKPNDAPTSAIGGAMATTLSASPCIRITCNSPVLIGSTGTGIFSAYPSIMPLSSMGGVAMSVSENGHVKCWRVTRKEFNEPGFSRGFYLALCSHHRKEKR